MTEVEEYRLVSFVQNWGAEVEVDGSRYPLIRGAVEGAVVVVIPVQRMVSANGNIEAFADGVQRALKKAGHKGSVIIVPDNIKLCRFERVVDSEESKED